MTPGSDDLAALATAAMEQGRMADAARYLQRIARAVPEPANWFNLGIARRGARDFAGALEAYGRAIELGEDVRVDALVNRAVMLKDDLGRVEDAEADLARAVALDCRSVPAWFNLGLLHEVVGRRDAARDAYASVVAAEPLNALAHARLAALDDDPQRGVARIVHVLRRGKFTQEQAAALEFALANALDRAGRYDEAFAVATRANDRKQRLARPEFRYDPAAQERLVDALIKVFPARPPHTPQRGDARPLFICGMFRSGSTATEQWLARHSAIAAGGEIELIPLFVRERLQPYPQAVRALAPARIVAFRREYAAMLDRIAPAAPHVTDKRCDNFVHLGLIKTLFPGATIVHTRRDPLDVAISTFFLEFAEPISYSTNLTSIGHYLVQHDRIMRHWENVFAGDIVPVAYEQLVADHARALNPVFDALGLASETLSANAPEGAIRTPSAWAVRGPLHTRSIGRWRNYADHLGPVIKALGL